MTGANDPGPSAARADARLGYDLVRLLAMACVALQHIQASAGLGTGHVLRYLDLGQGGVAVFCALSGFFAGRPGGGRPSAWLLRRLERVFVPYWIGLAALLGLNGLARFKPMTAGLVAAQFLGVAAATHPDQLVGVHFWFITLILICYGIAALVRFDGRLLAPWVALVALVPLDPGFKGHLLAFLTGMAAARSPRPGAASAAAALAWLAAAWAFEPLFAFPTLGALALLAGGLVPGRSPRAVALASQATYEFFLVHSPIFAGIAKLGAGSLAPLLSIGLPLSLASAWALRGAARSATRAIDGLAGSIRGPRRREVGFLSRGGEP